MVRHSNISRFCYRIKCTSNFILIILPFGKKLGSIELFHCGLVESGFWTGALVCEEAYSQNDDPETCNTSTGVTTLKTNFAKFTIHKNENKTICLGKGYQILKPGLSNNP
jgi:hypothetical protein